jgi:E3 ubiquitin-protein ligase HERC2
MKVDIGGQEGREHTPTIIEGLEEVRVRRVFAGQSSRMREAFNAFAIGEAGELFSWGFGEGKCVGRIDEEDQPSPKRVEALRDVQVSCVAIGETHGLALAEGGQVYAWGVNNQQSHSGMIRIELVPKPVKAFRGMRVNVNALQPGTRNELRLRSSSRAQERAAARP